jgi:hypothetical protein
VADETAVGVGTASAVLAAVEVEVVPTEAVKDGVATFDTD